VASTKLAFREVIQRLTAMYGPPAPAPAADPFELVLWESVAYLVEDDRRRSAFQALAAETPRDTAWLIGAHQLLRRHGKESCRRTVTHCEACSLNPLCAYYRAAGARGGIPVTGR
jgi:endonuclease III